MFAIAQEYYGRPLTWQRITPGDTVTALADGVYHYKELEIGYDASDHTFLAGEVIVGASSGAIGVVVSATVTSGAIGTDNAAGKIRIHSWNGINFTNNEKIKIAADTDVGDIDGTAPAACGDEYAFKGAVAKGILFQAESNAERISFGVKAILADQTAKYGMVIPTNGTTHINEADCFANVRVVDAVSGSAGSLICIGYF